MENFITIFEEAQRRTGADREAYLRAVCNGNQELRRQIEEKLAVSAKADDLFGETPESMTACGTKPDLPDAALEKPGSLIGRYKIREKIGQGGCGVVYVAEQEAPVRRRVALKLIKTGMDTRSVIARFDAERQALAMMDHPNIAKVLDEYSLILVGPRKL